jgi:hypothetical protein
VGLAGFSNFKGNKQSSLREYSCRLPFYGSFKLQTAFIEGI